MTGIIIRIIKPASGGHKKEGIKPVPVPRKDPDQVKISSKWVLVFGSETLADEFHPV